MAVYQARPGGRHRPPRPRNRPPRRPNMRISNQPRPGGGGGLQQLNVPPRPGVTPPPQAPPGAGPAPGPAQPPRPGATPPPRPEDDPNYNRAITTANTRLGDALSAIAGEKQGVEQDFGINDPTSPFNRASGLKKAFLQRRKGASASLASRGLLYSGAHEGALRRTREQEEQAYHELRQAYMAAIGSLSKAEQEANYANEDAREAAFLTWLNDPDRAEADVPVADEPEEVAPPEEGPAPAPAPGTTGPPLTSYAGPVSSGGQATNYPGAPAGSIKPATTSQHSTVQDPFGGNQARIQEIRRALMAHGPNWSQRPRLLRELQQLRGY